MGDGDHVEHCCRATGQRCAVNVDDTSGWRTPQTRTASIRRRNPRGDVWRSALKGVKLAPILNVSEAAIHPQTLARALIVDGEGKPVPAALDAHETFEDAPQVWRPINRLEAPTAEVSLVRHSPRYGSGVVPCVPSGTKNGTRSRGSNPRRKPTPAPASVKS